METQNTNRNLEPSNNDQNNASNRNRALGGLIVVIVGALFLAKQAGADFPYWFFSWPMILIAVGLFVGFRHGFRNPGWMIPIAIGTVFLLEDIMPELEIKQYLWPIVIIVIGLVMIFRPRGRNRDRWRQRHNRGNDSEYFANTGFETVTIFGSDKKQIISKEFKGGESVCVFGGVEINLTQADITGTAEIEIVQMFGGTKIIVPPHWRVQSDELVCIFGGLEDKRQVAGSIVDGTKTLIIKGTCIFGGIDLRSF